MELRILPFVNIEHEVLMLSSILNSNGAIQMNIQIMKIFIKMREMVLANKDLFTKIEQIEEKVIGHDEKIRMLIEYLKKF